MGYPYVLRPSASSVAWRIKMESPTLSWHLSKAPTSFSEIKFFLPLFSGESGDTALALSQFLVFRRLFRSFTLWSKTIRGSIAHMTVFVAENWLLISTFYRLIVVRRRYAMTKALLADYCRCTGWC